MANRDEILSYCDELLDCGSFEDYGPNGLQVPGRAEVSKVATGVTANLETLTRAAEGGAELVLTHHGLFWGDGVSPLSCRWRPGSVPCSARTSRWPPTTCRSTPIPRSATTPCSATRSGSSRTSAPSAEAKGPAGRR